MKKLLIILGVALIAVAVTLFVLLGRYTDRVIDPYVRSLLEHTKPMGHKITYDKIRVNLFEGLIKLKEVRMYPDSSLTDHDLRFEVSVKDIELTGFSIWKMLFHKNLIIDEFLIENPDIIITLPTSAEEVIEDVSGEEAPKKKSQLLTRIFLSRITLTEGTFKLLRSGAIIASSPNISLTAEEISLQKNSLDEPIGYTFGDYTITLDSIDVRNESGLYDISLDKFQASKKELYFVLTGFNIIPKYDKEAFSKKLPFQNDRFDVRIGEIIITHNGLWHILKHEPLEITKLKIDSVDADIYRDKNVPFNYNRFPPFYSESFMKIPIPIIIDTVMVTNSRLTYGELAEGKSIAGEIKLENFEMKVYNITNLVEQDTAFNVMQFNIEAKVMGEGKLKAEITLPLEGDMHDFECSGSVGRMQLAPLNGMLEPSMNITFNSGTVDRMTFAFTANDNVSRGWMEFLYSDLNVALLKKNPEKQWGFLSSLANTMALSNNPVDGKALKIVSVGYERDKNKGIINYIWKTIQSGMLHTILPTSKYQINKKEAQELNQQYRKQAKTQKKIDKQNAKTEQAKEKTK